MFQSLESLDLTGAHYDLILLLSLRQELNVTNSTDARKLMGVAWQKYE